MSFIAPHILIGEYLHCPINRVANRNVQPLPSDSHRYDCPSCGAALKIKDAPISRELVAVEPARKAVGQ